MRSKRRQESKDWKEIKIDIAITRQKNLDLIENWDKIIQRSIFSHLLKCIYKRVIYIHIIQIMLKILKIILFLARNSQIILSKIKVECSVLVKWKPETPPSITRDKENSKLSTTKKTWFSGANYSLHFSKLMTDECNNQWKLFNLRIIK